MKKIYYLMLSLLLIGTASMNAQVTIGSQDDPHAGAVLDLQSNATKGLLLPRVDLVSATSWSPLSGSSVAGMLVYNQTATEDLAVGVYFWDGEKWASAAGPVAPVDPNLPGTPGDWVSTNPTIIPGAGTQSDPYRNDCAATPSNTVVLAVKAGYTLGDIIPADAAGEFNGTLTFTKSATIEVIKGSKKSLVYVTISSCNVPVTGVSLDINSKSFTVANQTQQLTATVAPGTATNQSVTWSSSNDAVATVVNGLVTAVGSGNATITATTVDGGFQATCSVSVTITNADGSTPMTVGTGTYGTYDYGSDFNVIWMVQNSSEGTASANYFNNNPSQSNGKYYSWDQRENGCPGDDWRVPTSTEWNQLSTWVNNNKSFQGAKYWIVAANAYAGRYTTYGGLWDHWLASGSWWSDSGIGQLISAVSPNGVGVSSSANYDYLWISVRCVKNK